MDNLQRIKEKLQELVIKSNQARDDEDNPNHSDGFGMYWSGFCNCLKEIIPFVDSLSKEPVSEDIEKEANECWDYVFSALGWDENSLMTMDHEEFLAFARYFANWQKQQIMNGSTTRVVHIGEDLCPFIRRYELAFDIKSQVQDVKDGDKVKVIIIKED